jgi:hypothetical protein
MGAYSAISALWFKYAVGCQGVVNVPVTVPLNAPKAPNPGLLGSDKTTPLERILDEPLAPTYFPVPPVITDEELPTSGNGGVPEEKSMQVVREVSCV